MVHVLLRPSTVGSNVRYKNGCHTALKQSRCTCTTAYPRCAGHNGQFFLVCHKSCAYGFKTERVHLHHCIPLRWGTQWSIFFKTANQIVRQGKQSGCTCTTAYPRCAGHNGQFSFGPQKLTIWSRTSGVCSGAGARVLS